ncbi:MAG: RING finger protein [Chlamydiota bacterium]
MSVSTVSNIEAFQIIDRTQKNNLDPTMSCSICLVELKDAIEEVWVQASKCHNIFHESCLTEWFRHKTICPMCRRPTEETANPDHSEIIISHEEFSPTTVAEVQETPLHPPFNPFLLHMVHRNEAPQVAITPAQLDLPTFEFTQWAIMPGSQLGRDRYDWTPSPASSPAATQ